MIRGEPHGNDLSRIIGADAVNCRWQTQTAKMANDLPDGGNAQMSLLTSKAAVEVA
jgi:hypothetical protein